jgi:hypothetical protein
VVGKQVEPPWKMEGEGTLGTTAVEKLGGWEAGGAALEDGGGRYTWHNSSKLAGWLGSRWSRPGRRMGKGALAQQQ